MRLPLAALLALVITPALLPAAWHEVRSGPFIVLSEAGGDAARETAAHLEQFRHALGDAIGRDHLSCRWPITVVIRRRSAESWPVDFSRDGYLAAWPERGAPGPDWFAALARLLLDENLKARMPESYEEALAAAYSTLEVDGVRLTFGAHPPPEARTPAWALIHLFTTTPAARIRLRVLLSNLANGAEERPAFRNSFQEEKPALEQKARAHLAAGAPGTASLNAMTLDARRLTVRDALPSRIRLLPGDLALAQGHFDQARAAYEAGLKDRPAPALHEGLGLALAALGDTASARNALAEAAKAEVENPGPRALAALAQITSDPAEARALLERAAQVKPDWPEPFLLAAGLESGPVRQAYFLAKAAELRPRDAALWERLALAQMAAQQFDEATKSWAAALRASPDQQGRDRLVAARRDADQKRIDALEEEKRRKAAEERAELDRLKAETEARIRAAEDRANRASGDYKPPAKIEQWWDGPETKPFDGLLERVVCSGATARLHLRPQKGPVLQFTVPDLKKFSVLGAAEATLVCGPQKPPKRVQIRVLPDTRQAVSLEFQ
jgi:tetratricopeptide (TPR) repeat protein